MSEGIRLFDEVNPIPERMERYFSPPGQTRRRAAIAAANAEQAHTLALAEIQTFADIWSVGLILFGVHLMTLAYLIYQAAYAPKILGVLVAIAGFGYLIDSFGTILSATYSLELALFTFVGELVLIGWLLLRGRRLELQPEATPSVE